MGEIDRDPALRARIADVLGHETHGDQKGAQAVMETMINRALRLGHTSLWQTISKKDDKIPGSGFYGPVNRNELRGASANDLKIADEATRALPAEATSLTSATIRAPTRCGPARSTGEASSRGR